MFNFKISGIAAAAAFILSFLIGLISHSIMPMLLVRPLIFAAVFFGISAFIHILVSHFLPELLEGSAPGSGPEILSGSQINIVEGDSDGTAMDYSSGALSSAAAPGLNLMGAMPDDSSDDLGDISALTGAAGFAKAPMSDQDPLTAEKGISEGMDHNAKNGYTQNGGMPDLAADAGESRRAGMGMFGDSEEPLPDLDSMAGAFTSNFSEEESDAADFSAPAASKKASSKAKGAEWSGDFNAKDIAMGLRTVLNKDKVG